MVKVMLGHGANHEYCASVGKRADSRSIAETVAAGAARNAVDSALWDLQARQRQQSLAGLLGVTLSPVFTTAQTVVIGTPEQMAASAAALWEKGRRC